MTKQLRIAIVGSGKVGRALGGWLAASGHSVVFTSRKEAAARDAAEHAGHGARAASVVDAVRASELILLTTPFDAAFSALEPARAELAGKVLVDVTNPITEDHKDLKIGHNGSGSEQIAEAFPEANVVKAFNAVFAEVYEARSAQLGSQPVSIFFAGDDATAKQLVASVITSLAFDAVDSGPLRNARYLEPLSLLNIHLGRVLGNGTSIGFALTRAPT